MMGGAYDRSKVLVDQRCRGAREKITETVEAESRGRNMALSAKSMVPHGRVPLTRSAARAFDVMEYFLETGASARTTDISSHLGIPNSSTDELLKTMTVKGYLAFDKVSRRYHPSYRLMTLVQGLERQFFGDGLLREMLNCIKQETGCTVIMTAQKNYWLEIIAEVEGPWILPSRLRKRPSQIVRYGAAGWQPGCNFAAALLSLYSNVEVVELAVQTQSLSVGCKESVVMQGLVEQVHTARNRGYAVCREASAGGSIACPMRIPGTNTPVAVGIVAEEPLGNDESIRQLAFVMRRLIRQHCRQWSEHEHKMMLPAQMGEACSNAGGPSRRS